MNQHQQEQEEQLRGNASVGIKSELNTTWLLKRNRGDIVETKFLRFYPEEIKNFEKHGIIEVLVNYYHAGNYKREFWDCFFSVKTYDIVNGLVELHKCNLITAQKDDQVNRVPFLALHGDFKK